MKKYLFLSTLFACITGWSYLYADSSTLIPIDTRVRIGKLSNGLTYYIRHNEKPKDRADFYIVQKVGSILEEDNQNGLAHFLEHMAFNGTKNFPDKQLINFLERNGVKFGENINAYTSLDETVYNLSNVPTSRQGVIDSSLLILHDWSNYISLENKEIDKERGVILEEWRTSSTADQRILKASNSILLAGSQYAHRDVIGDTAIINHFSYQALRDYYKKWYRPDLQAIVVVGNIDVDKLEKQIKTLFSKIPTPVNPSVRKYYTVPDNETPIIARLTDPEASGISFLIQFKQPAASEDHKKSIVGYKHDIMNSLICQMQNNRFQEIIQNSTLPMAYAASQYSNMVKTKDALFYYMSPRDGQNKEAISLLFKEIEKTKRFGFNADELERAKSELFTQYEHIYNNRDQQNSTNFVREYISNFLNQEAIPGVEWEYKTLQSLLPTLNLDTINSLIRSYIKNTNVLITEQGPDNKKHELISEQEILTIFNNSNQMVIEANKRSDLSKSLIAHKPTPGVIAKKSSNNNLGTEEWTLSNGIKVIFKPTQFKKDEIRLLGIAYGGLSLIKNVDDLPSATISDNVIVNSGIGEFSNIELNKLLAGKIASVTPSISDYQETFSGASSIKDFEIMMQMLYLYFTAPRKDKDGYESFISNVKTSLINAANDPEQAFSDSITTALYCKSARKFNFDLNILSKVSHEKVMQLYKERFANPANFTFFIVGNIDSEKCKPSILQYLGGLNTNSTKETWQDQQIRYPKGINNIKFNHTMKTPKSSNFILYHDTITYNLNNSLLAQALGNLLNLKYIATIREDEGGSYSVGVNGSIGKLPIPEVTLFMQFDTDPKKQARMIDLIYKGLNDIATQGPSDSEINKVKENLRKQHAENLEENGWWLSAINHYYFSNINLLNDFDSAINYISTKTLKQLAKKLIDSKNKLQVTMDPK